MTPHEHAILAEQLIDKCGGLIRAAGFCRVGKTLLSLYQTAGSKHFMPADVILDLEAEAKDRVYSRALFEAGPVDSATRNLLDEACEAIEANADLLKGIRLATEDGALTNNERHRLLKQHAHLTEEVRQVGVAIAGNAKPAA